MVSTRIRLIDGRVSRRDMRERDHGGIFEHKKKTVIYLENIDGVSECRLVGRCGLAVE